MFFCQCTKVFTCLHGLNLKTYNNTTELGQCLTSPSMHKVLGSIPGKTHTYALLLEPLPEL